MFISKFVTAWGFPIRLTLQWRSGFQPNTKVSVFHSDILHVQTLRTKQKLFKLLKPEDIGIQLTDGFMMEPEASVTALVFAHPEAKYFNVL